MAANSTTTIFGNTLPRYIEQLPKSKRIEVFGLGFPLGKNSNSGGFFKKETGVPLIKSAVKQLLLTERGERVMLPNFGCNLRKFLFQPLTEDVFNDIREEIETSFNNYIIGANLVKLAVFPTGVAGPSGGNSLKVILSIVIDKSELEIFDVEVNIT